MLSACLVLERKQNKWRSVDKLEPFPKSVASLSAPYHKNGHTRPWHTYTTDGAPNRDFKSMIHPVTGSHLSQDTGDKYKFRDLVVCKGQKVQFVKGN